MCNPKDFQTLQEETTVKDFLLENNFKFSSNSRSLIYPYELDILLENKNIAIEIDGLHWHSSLKGKDENYHLNKTNLCEDKDIKLIHIFEDDIVFKWPIVKSYLKRELKLIKNIISIKNCDVKLIDVDKANNFILENSLYAFNDKNNYNCGLYFEGHLIAVFSGIINGKFIINNWAILNDLDFEENYYDVFYKLKSFINLNLSASFNKFWFNLKDFDNRWFNIYVTNPNMFYTYNFYRLTYEQFLKSDLKEKISSINENLSIEENMNNLKFKKIWDCGNIIAEL